LTKGIFNTTIAYVDSKNTTFGGLFKKYRLRSGFVSLREFADALARKGFIYEESIFSHWQKNTRTPKDRKLLLQVVEIFIEREGITTLNEVNKLLDTVGQGYLTEEEAEKISRNPNILTKPIATNKLLNFFLEVGRSKRIIRTGWKLNKVKDPESVAEHSFQLSVMAMILADQLGVDREKLIKMAVIHDLGELITGDLVWSKGKMLDIEKRTQKEEQEMQGILKIFKTINKADEFSSIFQEMVERKSIEAKIFWQLDKLEMAIQALQYERESGKNLEEFFINTDFQLTNPLLRGIFGQATGRRPKKKI